MPRYLVRRRYRSYRDGQQFGPWPVGAEIDLPGDAAEWVERDSPGTLQPVCPPATPDAEHTPAIVLAIVDTEGVGIVERETPEAEPPARRDRMRRTGPRRSTAETGLG